MEIAVSALLAVVLAPVILILLLAFYLIILPWLLMRGKSLTLLDILDALDTQEWRTAEEVAQIIVESNGFPQWVHPHVWGQCSGTLPFMKVAGLTSSRKREGTKRNEYLLVGDGIRRRYEARDLSPEAAGVPVPNES